MVAVLDADDHPGGLERAQPDGQPVAGRAGVAGDRVEPLVAERDLADREQRPLLADDVQGGRHRAGTAGQIFAHETSILGCEIKLTQVRLRLRFQTCEPEDQ